MLVPRSAGIELDERMPLMPADGPAAASAWAAEASMCRVSYRLSGFLSGKRERSGEVC